MKAFYLLVFVGIILAGCSSKSSEMTISQLEERDGVYYLIETNQPYTGKIVSRHLNGEVNTIMHIENGASSREKIDFL